MPNLYSPLWAVRAKQKETRSAIDDDNETTRPIERFVAKALEKRLEKSTQWAWNPNSEDDGDETAARNTLRASDVARRLGLSIFWMRAAVTRMEIGEGVANTSTPGASGPGTGSTGSRITYTYAFVVNAPMVFRCLTGRR
ncbi:hypothetical protein BDV93DRAFT_172571 [Ceratobasidium sp. AG-I]|nr:hypothetical protein BDV93DRAFT_172571 [Ceratobasidium sp. AG-I]